MPRGNSFGRCELIRSRSTFFSSPFLSFKSLISFLSSFPLLWFFLLLLLFLLLLPFVLTPRTCSLVLFLTFSPQVYLLLSSNPWYPRCPHLFQNIFASRYRTFLALDSRPITRRSTRSVANSPRSLHVWNALHLLASVGSDSKIHSRRLQFSPPTDLYTFSFVISSSFLIFIDHH